MADTLESLELEIVHSATGAADEINKVTAAVRSLSRALGKAIPNLKTFKAALGDSDINFNDNSTTQIADTINNVQQAASKAHSATKRAASGIRALSKEASKSKGPLATFVESLKRIAFYRFIRTIIKAITTAFKEGLENAYIFSSGIATEGHRFSESLDSMKSAGTQMKNQLGAAFIALLTAIEPVITAIISLVTQLANALSMLFAVFTGSTYMKAVKVGDKFADTMERGAGAAKEWKNQLLGFDVINRLNEPSGGGGGSSALDPSTMFEDVPIPDWLLNAKELLDSGRFADFGRTIAEKVNEAVENLDTRELGEKIGNWVNGAAQSAYGFISNVNFKNIGGRIAEFLNGALSRIDSETAGRTLTRWFTSAIDTLIGFVDRLDVKQIARSISGFITGAFNEASNWLKSQDWKYIGEMLYEKVSGLISGIDWEGISSSVGGFFVNALNSLSQFVSSIDWFGIGNTLYDALKRCVSGINYSEVARSFFRALGTSFGAVVKALDGFFSGVWTDLRNYLDRKMKEAGGNAFKAFLNGILDAINVVGTVKEWIRKNISVPFYDGLRETLGIDKSNSQANVIGGMVSEGFTNGIVNNLPWLKQVSWLASTFGALITGVKSLFKIGSPSKVFEEIGRDIVAGFSGGFKTNWDTFVSNVKIWWSNLKSWWDSLSLKTIVASVVGSNSAGTTVSSNGFSGTSGKIPLLMNAAGGFPDEGQLFMAREAGPELVGTIGGRTAVANNDQIVESIRSGVYDAVSSAFSGRNDSVSVRVYLDSKEIKAGQQRLARAMGV